jgi:hypothetical protein
MGHLHTVNITQGYTSEWVTARGNVRWSIAWESGRFPEDENTFMPLSDSADPTANRVIPYRLRAN